MSPRRWILLLIFYISYLMFGASIYYHIEHNIEKQQRAEALNERIEINAYLLEQLSNKNATTQDEVLQRITDYCGKPVTDYHTDEFDPPYTWTFYHSFFFAFTVCSTVGYGNISPNSTLGRMIMIFYSLIGIPVNAILFSGLGDYFSRMFQAIYRRYKKYKMSNDVRYVPPQLGLVTTVAIALIPGISLFILLPSWAFSYFEDWPYSLAIYYSYVTTTTIGFGDYVPTFQPHQPSKFGAWFIVYEVSIIIWFIFSLGYLLMIMTFITRGLQSKKLAYLEQQLSSNIKSTQNRIWNGVTKDVGYLRRILNELYILKFKPVYNEPDYHLYRSNSCPDLSMYRVDPPVISRKRAYSECYDVHEARQTAQRFMVGSSSDTDLDKFDRQKSFESAEAFRQTTGMLAKVVSALASVQAPPSEELEHYSTIGSAGMYGGYHGFSDSQILASEWSFPSVQGGMQQQRRRGRACSDFNINPTAATNSQLQNEWTWSGGDNNQLQLAINNRVKLSNGQGTQRPMDYVLNVEEDDAELKPRVKKFSVPDGLRKLFPFKKRNSQLEFLAASDAAAAASATNGGTRKFSVVSVPEMQAHAAHPADYYSTVNVGRKSTLPPILQSAQLFPSDGSLSSRLSAAAHTDSEQATLPLGTTNAYQRNAAAATRKRRESIFAQNPAIAARRGSMFPPTAAALNAQRRGSLFNNNNERRGSNVSMAAPPTMPLPPRRGSMFPSAGGAGARRPSLFSSTSNEDMDVLEQTTLADLIRALEVMHTQAVMDDNNAPSGGPLSKSDKKKRKASAAALEPPSLPPLLALLGGANNNNKVLSTTAANRLYARRATIVGTLPASFNNASTLQPSQLSSLQSTANAASGSILTQRRRQSTVQIVEPPPSYTEKDAAAPKFNRRFSIRPTALQIPPGKAPPPGVNISSLLQSNAGVSAAAPTTTSSPSITSNMSQTALQRRLSLRPSPLARELTLTPVASGGGGAGGGGTNSSVSGADSSARLLPPPAGLRSTATTSSSTHSPLSRIVQISQAQRKSSMPDGYAQDRNKKPEGGK